MVMAVRGFFVAVVQRSQAAYLPDFAGFESESLANTEKCILGGHYTAPLFNSVKRGAVVWVSGFGIVFVPVPLKYGRHREG